MESVKELQVLEDLKVEDVEEVKEKPLQKLKIKKGEKPVMEDGNINTPKPKKERTQKQMEAFAKAREKMVTNLKVRKEKEEQDAVIKKKELEEKIVKKAVAIKKREIKQKAILDAIQDDDTPIEEIKKIASKIKPLVEPEKPKTIFEKYKFI
jgi:hypothetical protein